MKIETDALALPGIRHGFFTRKGGVSDGVYGSLNIGLGSKDDPARVEENRSRVAGAMGVEPDRLVTPWQHHSAATLTVERPWTADDRPRADAVVTGERDLAIAVSTADCTPVLFADADAGIVGAAHAGWRGAFGGVLESAIGAMVDLGAERSRIVAVIGPTISQDNYEVGHDFRDTFLAADPENDRWFIVPPGRDKPHFDLPGYAASRLRRAGVGTVHDLGLCTYGDESRFYSYRRSTHRAEPDYGRLISAIALD